MPDQAVCLLREGLRKADFAHSRRAWGRRIISQLSRGPPRMPLGALDSYREGLSLRPPGCLDSRWSQSLAHRLLPGPRVAGDKLAESSWEKDSPESWVSPSWRTHCPSEALRSPLPCTNISRLGVSARTLTVDSREDGAVGVCGSDLTSSKRPGPLHRGATEAGRGLVTRAHPRPRLPGGQLWREAPWLETTERTQMSLPRGVPAVGSPALNLAAAALFIGQPGPPALMRPASCSPRPPCWPHLNVSS